MSLPVPPAARRFAFAVTVSGSAAIVWALAQLLSTPVSPWWLVLLGLTSFSSTFSIRIPHVTSTISVSETFVFLCALLYGPAPATLIVAVDGLVMSFWRGYRKPVQVSFNTAQPPLSLLLASLVYAAIAGHEMGTTRAGMGFALVPIAAFVVTYFLLTSGLNAVIVALHRQVPIWQVWRQHFGWVLLNYLGATSVATLLLIQNQNEFDVSTIAIVLPLLIISYFTFKSSLQRVEDANRHLEDLNTLYLSTIETLAMAVDAKDQVTHGHIRRVQAYAIGLAKVIGVTDERELKAIEAAALLHDLGKLAIPEHILNKPGKLSNAEFDKMKKHASIGADILSAIDFPYPVVPIVRHHHERWDGRGYPDGIKGADIPIGARILSVVDCFDALTSDRPYRRALTDADALAMLLADREKAYDPIVVDAFARVYQQLEPSAVDLGRHAETLREIAAVSQAEPESSLLAPMPAPALHGDADGSTDPMMVPLLESMHAFSAQTVLTDAVEDLAHILQASTPATLCAFFVTQADGLELTLGHAVGTDAEHLRGMHFPKGEKLSGWVAATHRTVCNSDPSLDFIDLSPAPVGLASCLSVPLLAGDSLVGVLSLYAPGRSAFNDLHRRTVERSARPLAHLMRGVLDFERVQAATAQGALAALPVIAAVVGPEVCTTPTAVISFKVVSSSGTVPDLVIARAAAALRRDLRVADFLYRDGPAGLLAVLPHVDRRGATMLALRAHARVASSLASQAGDVGACSVVTGVATAPGDGVDLDLVMQAARDRAAHPRADDGVGGDRMRQPHLFESNAGAWVDVA